MKTILATTYALNPYKGSEDGMGWNMICQIARFNNVIAITRKNNRTEIEKFMKENMNSIYENISFQYYDLPYWMRFWKKGQRGAMFYFYLWQFFMPVFVWFNRFKFDIAHNLNFHNDWTPTFLWVLGKPMVWGAIGHHPQIPKQYINNIYENKWEKADARRWRLKKIFWKWDPFLKLSIKKSAQILCMNSSVTKELRINENKITLFPSVGSEDVVFESNKAKSRFDVLSVGRFVPLKGFDITIRSFANFYHSLCEKDQQKTTLTLVGKGPVKELLESIAKDLKVNHVVHFIDWIEREKLKDIYKNSSVFLFPSHEGAGMVVSEAMSYGLPVVCLDNYGPGEFVTPQSGLKVKIQGYDGTIKSFSDHLNNLFLHDEFKNHLSQGARRRFEEYFHWDAKGELLVKIYDQITCKEEVTESILTY